MLHEALLTPQLHVRAAALVSDSVFSWSTHEQALRVLHKGTRRALFCSARGGNGSVAAAHNNKRQRRR